MGETICTTCPYCGVGCGIKASLEGERSVRITGDPAHPANMGRLCSKGTHLAETVGLEGRLLQPMIGDEAVGWDTALDDVAARMRDTIKRYGPDAVAFYVSGQLLTEDYYVANKLLKGFVGTANIDTNSRLCMASAVAAHQRAFGEDIVPCSYADLDEADLILLVGSNTAWCHPVIWQRIEKARDENGTKLVVIDPRRTETAELADLHIPVTPDGDVALFNALLAAMAERGALDDAFLEQHCDVPSGFFDALEAGSHGIAPDVFARLAELIAGSPRMVTLFSQGANQSVCGTDKGNAIINLHLATGRINRPGAGPFSMTGQPNAMGGREVGGLASTLACHLGFSEAERAAVSEFWQAPGLCESPGLKAVDLFRAVHSGDIKFVWIMATNPAVSMPDAAFVRDALVKCPNVVVSDMIADTDTAKLAHVRLPAMGWGEKDGTVTNSERVISRQRAIFPPAGEARADWRIICDVARRLGHDEAFAFSGSADIFREYAAMTQLSADHGKLLDLTAWAECSDAAYAEMAPFQWGGRHPCAAGFPTPDGKAALVPVREPQPASRSSRYPLTLNTGRYRDQWHTMTRTGLSAKLSSHRREPKLEVSPADAAANGLTHGGFASVISAHGTSCYRVQVNEGQTDGQLFVPMHFTDANSGAGRTGKLIHPQTDPHSGQPGFKNVPVTIEAVQPEWRAFLLTRERAVPQVLYWASSRIETGWLTELAGFDTISLDELLPQGPRSEVNDMVRGMQRIAVFNDAGEPAALLYLTRTGVLPDRDWIVRQFANPQASIGELLAGRPATPTPDTGPTVCVCHDVGEATIVAAIDEGAEDVDAIGRVTCAGTNCGSCRPILSRLLEHQQSRLKEAAE